MTREIDIVVVDDEPDIREMLTDYLTPHGFRVREAESAAALDRRLAERPADLVLLDVNMPGESGLAALARLRQAGLQAGVILLTAADALSDRVDGLTQGADDHLAKPFVPRELLARIRAVLRRVPPAAPPQQAVPATRAARFGRFRIDFDGRRLLDPEGVEVPLTAMEFDLLAVLARHPRQTLSRGRLAELAHGRPAAPGDRSVDIRMLRLRHKIEEDPANPRILRTVRGEGYAYDPGD